MADSDHKIEPAHKIDIHKMQNLWQSMPGLGFGIGDEEETLKIFIERNPSTSLVLKKGEQLIGTVLGGFDGRRGYIYHLAVHPDYQHKGYGRLLLNKVTDELRTLGAGKIHLFVYNGNENAINFYRYNNWVLREDIRVFTWDDS